MKADAERKDGKDTGSHEDFLAAWETFVRATRRSRARANAERRGGLTLSQFHLASTLKDGPRPSMEAAELAGMSGATATRMFDTLERAGVVIRWSLPSDRRVSMAELTPEGRRKVDEMNEVVEVKRRALSESLSPEERALAIPILRRLADAVERTEP